MHAKAIIRGCLLACSLGVGGAMLLILAAASALSSAPPDWTRVTLVAFGVGLGAAIPLTGAALLGARLAARHNRLVPWWWGVLGGGAVAALGALILSGGPQGWLRMLFVFGPIGALTGAAAWIGAFGFAAQVPFGSPDRGPK